jgi:hypothetical protein
MREVTARGESAARSRSVLPWVEKTYLLGSPTSRFAVTRTSMARWRLPWQRPRGGWWMGRMIVWWSL